MTIAAALAAAIPGLDLTAPFEAAFASASRRFGKAPIAAAHVAAIRAAGLVIPDDLGHDECARGAMLVAAEPSMELVRDLVRRGEVRERQAVLRVLAALPEPARFLHLAVDACRTNVEGVFQAIACDNAFPALHFPDAAFHQMVLKALFTGAPLARVHRLRERTTDELVRMVRAYASERRAAGRTVPEDAKLVTGDP